MDNLKTTRNFFKVLFKGALESEENLLNLTFEAISLKEPVRVDSNFINHIKETAEKKSNLLFFQNIEEVLQLGDHPQKNKYNYYYVLLFTNKSDKRRIGVLIGNLKAIGDIIIGIWPIDFKLKKDLNIKAISSELNDIKTSPENFIDITLIN